MQCCRKCQKNLPITEFYKIPRNKSGYSYKCKACTSQDRRRYRLTEKGQIVQKRNNLKHFYGLSLEQHKEMYIEQNGCCAICKQSVSYDKVIVDHSHITNKIRGLLCYACNIGLGYIERDGFIENSLKYLETTKYIEVIE